MLNSPRETITVPARTWPAGPIPPRRAAHAPTPILVSAVTSPSANPGSSIGGMSAGRICNPKKTKKTAANRSRSGASRVYAFSATRPDSAMPTRKAPTASETWTSAAAPATREGQSEHDQQQHL